jgi:hypothetical protein
MHSGETWDWGDNEALTLHGETWDWGENESLTLHGLG